MQANLEKLLTKLRSRISSEDFPYNCESVIEEMKILDNQDEVLDETIRLFEEYPDVDFGLPGPLVHFAESFYRRGYEQRLLDSINRRPTTHTLWMLNRLLNGISAAEKPKYLSALRSVADSAGDNEELSRLAEEFLSLHAD